MPTNEEINEVQEWINSGRIYAPTSCDRARLIRFLETLAGAYRELLGRVEATEAELAAMKADAEMGSYSDAALDNQALREHLAIEAHYRLALEDIANLQTIIKDNGLYDFTLEDARAVARDRLAKPAAMKADGDKCPECGIKLPGHYYTCSKAPWGWDGES